MTSAMIQEPFDPTTTPTLVDAVADALREAILSGRMVPDQRLVESELARELRVSRGSVREALSLLDKGGDRRPGCRAVASSSRGSHPASSTSSTASEWCSSPTPRSACRHLDDSGRVRLEAALAAIAESVGANDAQALARSDIAFHDLLYELADHDLLMRAWQENIAGRLRILLNVTTRTCERAGRRRAAAPPDARADPRRRRGLVRRGSWITSLRPRSARGRD